MAATDVIPSAVLVTSETEHQHRVALNLINGPTVTDRPALKRADLDFGPVVVRALVLLLTEGSLTHGLSTQTFTIGQLPAGAHVLGCDFELLKEFTNAGGGTYLTADIGSSGDPDALVDGADLMTAHVDFVPVSVPPGIAPHKRFGAATDITVTVNSDDDFDQVTNGGVYIRVLYVVPATG